VINHTFSFHVWLWPKNNLTSTLLHKDTGKFEFTHDRHLKLELNLLKPTVSLVRHDNTKEWYKAHTTDPIASSEWAYLVYSIALVNGGSTEITFARNGEQIGAETLRNVFLIDSKAYETFIGSSRIGLDDRYENTFHGFIYEFHIY
jgi:hypothetical protein